MSDFLYDKMSRGMKRVVLLGFVLGYFGLAGTIVYVVVHFVLKYW